MCNEKKILLWKRYLRGRNTEIFPSVQNTNKAIISLIIKHLTTIEENFEKYFPLLNTEQFD